MTDETAIKILEVIKETHDWNPAIITEGDVIALDLAIKALRNERPQGNCKNCKAYRQYGSRADGYCGIPRMTSEGEQYINVNGNFYCSYYEETDNEEKDNI